MKKIPRISEAEWEILSVLWKKSPLTAAEVFAAIPNKSWKSNTVRTFLARLEKKGAVRAQERPEEVKRFVPMLTQEACVRQESDSFLNRVFEGATAALLLHFAESKRLSAEELTKLEAILAEKRKQKGN